MPNGRAGFGAALASVGESDPDARFEIKILWAMHEVRAHLMMLAEGLAAQAVTASAISGSYRSHIGQYSHAEHRFYDLIERIPSEAEARRLARRLGAGKRFAKVAVKEAPELTSHSFQLPHGEGKVLRAVYSARIGTLVGPLKLRGQYALFVLRRIDRARVQPLSEVRASIAQSLRARLKRRAYARLVGDYQTRWRTRTSCRPGYVMPLCRQYQGSLTPEGEPLAGP